MDGSTISKLIECLDALERGESLQQVLERYPEDRAQLQPLLETAVQLTEVRIQPLLSSKMASRESFLAEAAALRAASHAGPSPIIRLRRLLLPLAILVIVFLSGAGLISVSASAVPGEPLYGAKRFAESLQLRLTIDPGGRDDLLEQFRQERIYEIQLLLEEGRTAEIEFEGDIERIDGDTWIIAGLNTQVNGETQISGVAQEGRLAAVNGVVQEGNLIAVTIRILDDDQPVPTPTPASTPSPTASALPTLMPQDELVDDAQPTATVTPTNTPSPEPTPSETPTATATATVEPTATATPSSDPLATAGPTANQGDGIDDDDNDNEEDEDNSNEEDEDNSNEEDEDNSNEEEDNSNEEEDNSNEEEDNSNEEEDNSNEEDEESNENDDENENDGSD